MLTDLFLRDLGQNGGAQSNALSPWNVEQPLLFGARDPIALAAAASFLSLFGLVADVIGDMGALVQVELLEPKHCAVDAAERLGEYDGLNCPVLFVLAEAAAEAHPEESVSVSVWDGSFGQEAFEDAMTNEGMCLVDISVVAFVVEYEEGLRGICGENKPSRA